MGNRNRIKRVTKELDTIGSWGMGRALSFFEKLIAVRGLRSEFFDRPERGR